MKAIFLFPPDYTWQQPKLPPRDWKELEGHTYTRSFKSGTTCTLDPPKRHIVIESNDTTIPWVAIYVAVRRLMGKGIKATRLPTAKAWFRSLHVLSHEGAYADRHPVDARKADTNRIISITEGGVRYDKNYGFSTKKEFLTVMGQLYDKIIPSLRKTS